MVSRRDFLRVGSLSVVGLSMAEQAAMARSLDAGRRRSCIFIMMTGGPSQLETFDPKPDAPTGVRGPLRAISTAVPGVAFSEGLPKLAERANRFAVVRSLHHTAAPIHETGFQLLQTGRLARGGRTFPSFGAVVARALGPRNETAPHVVLPAPLANTGVNAYRGQGGGFWGSEFDPVTADSIDPRRDEPASLGTSLADESDATLRAYGRHRFGRLLLHARQLVERGVRCVNVNLFDSLVDHVTWDCHANGPSAPATLYDYRDELCPRFDQALAALLDDLQQRGLLDDTLVVATGEFGRTPRLNPRGGRDHWPGCWTALLAGAGIQGSAVLGSSDAQGAAPKERPVEPAEITATVYDRLGLKSETRIVSDDGSEYAAVECEGLRELV